MIELSPVLRVVEALDALDLTPRGLKLACTRIGWLPPVGDGVGIWEAEHSNNSSIVLDTVTTPPTLICCLHADDEYEPEALLDPDLRADFDSSFNLAEHALLTLFGECCNAGTYCSPFNWRFSCFRGNTLQVSLEQTFYDPQMGVQLLLLAQPIQPEKAPAGPVTPDW